MPGKSSKYSVERSQQIAVEAFSAIQEAEGPLCADEILNRCPAIAGTTPQKLARELSKYIELGLIRKVKKNGRVAYARTD